MSEREHSHIPYLVILYKYLEIWNSQNDTVILPNTYKEKEKFKENLKTRPIHKLMKIIISFLYYIFSAFFLSLMKITFLPCAMRVDLLVLLIFY